MPLQLFNEALDDSPDKVEADGFVGFDSTTEPTKIEAAIARAGANVWMDVDLLLQTRPALKFNTLLTRAALGGGSQQPRGMGYYDVPAREAVLVSGDAKLYEITGDGNNVTSNVLTPTPSATVDAQFSQLVDRMFWSDGTLHWSMYSGGAWSHGTVTTFSDASAMPTWGTIVSHGFRLMALDPATGKIYASAIGTANNAADWVKTENIRVGTGEGDPPVALISGQAGNLIVLNERSAWSVDTSNATVANWTSTKITGLTGCVERKTAVQAGQDVIFLSAFGVVSLARLADAISINEATTLSAPIQNYIDRINPSGLSAAWAVMWENLYLLALPLDAATVPNTLLAFHILTRKWMPPWDCTLPNLTVGATTITFAGWVCGVAANFASRQNTLICDNTGRALRLAKTAVQDESAAATTQEITSWMTTKAWNHGLPENFKQPFSVQIEWFGSLATNVQINLVRDGNATYPTKALNACEIIASAIGTNAGNFFPITFPITFLGNTSYVRPWTLRDFPRYRAAGIQIVSQKSRMKLRAVRLTAFIDAPSLE